MSTLEERLAALVGIDRVTADAPLAAMTTLRVGGPADWLVETRTPEELCGVVGLARRERLPVTILGGGSNLLIADAGIRGLVVRPRGGDVSQVSGDRIRADAAVTINGLVRWTISRGLAGLEAWAGTPGTVGGAIYGNAHFQGRLVGELVTRIGAVSPEAELIELSGEQLEFGYDRSRLQRTGEILLWAEFRVSAGDPTALRRAARESLTYRKATQPLQVPSAGCIFQNPDPVLDPLPEGMPCSAGALIDRAGLKGRRIGGARVSPLHGNFIVNDQGARAADVRALIDECQQTVLRRFGVRLKEEIVSLGVF